MINKKEHKFFDRYLNNDLESLKVFLSDLREDIYSGKIDGITAEMASNCQQDAPTQLGHLYNIFEFDNVNIYNLKNSISEMVKEACEYYNIPFENYTLTGWFNYDINYHNFDLESLHDHLDGNGIPYFHGYYCVDAEPSFTHYDINKNGKIFLNENKNNRAILSETGHPHARGTWARTTPRITIAYDISYAENGVKI